MLASARLLLLSVALVACAKPSAPSVRRTAFASSVQPRIIVPVVPVLEPTGHECLTHDKAEQTLASLLRSVGSGAELDDVELSEATCHKRAYVVGTARIVIWQVGELIRGKGTKLSHPLPTTACIDRALAQAHDFAPFADAIIEREVAQDPELWRDPDVGLVSWLECDGDQPKFATISTMLHETNHRVSRGKCIFDFSTQRELCFELEDALPLAIIAAYPTTPSGLDPLSATEFLRVQKLYLEQNGQRLRELLDEVMAYRIEAELHAVGIARKIYPEPGVTTFDNLPLMMALVMRYVNELGVRDPQLAAKEFGPTGRNRATLVALLDQAEASYKVWLSAVGTPGAYERTFFADYERGRRRWLSGAN